MLDVRIGKQSYQDETQYKNLEQLLEDILFNKIDTNSIITSIDIDGQNFENIYDPALLSMQTENFSTISINTKKTIDLAYESLESCSNYINFISDNINQLIEMYAKNEIDKANIKFQEVVEITDLFVQLISKVLKVFKENDLTKKELSKDIQNLEIHLLSVLKGLIPAKEKNDIIMLCDLLEYELVDNLTQWKIKIIPALKARKK